MKTAYIREGLLSEGFLSLRFGGFTFGGAYHRNFKVFLLGSKSHLKLEYLADTTLPRSFRFAFTEAVNTYSDDTTGSLLPKAIQKPSKLQNCPEP